MSHLPLEVVNKKLGSSNPLKSEFPDFPCQVPKTTRTWKFGMSPGNMRASVAEKCLKFSKLLQEKFEAAKAKYDEKMEAFLANGGEKKARKSRKEADLGQSLENLGTLSILLWLNGM